MSIREFTTPGEVTVPDDAHLVQALVRHATTTPNRALLSVKAGEAFHDVSARDMWAEVELLARGLIGLGVQPGDRVALMSTTRPEWTYLDYAILASGAATVPIYDSSSADQIEWIVSDSGARIVIFEDEEMKSRVPAENAALSQCEHVFTIDGGGLDTIRAAADGVSAEAVAERMAHLGRSSLATIIYTSGTTGRPKGCMLTHGNLTWDVAQVVAALDGMIAVEDTQLLFLPLAHSYAKILVLFAMEIGSKVGYSAGSTHLVDEMPVFRPTYLSAVPRIFERVYTRAHDKAAEGGKDKIFDRASDVAIAWSQAIMAGRRPDLLLRLQHALFDKLVYSKMRHLFGGQLRLANSGGGPLGERLSHFFNGVGIHVYEGYGLTETSPVLTCNSVHGWKIGSVGRPIPGTTIRIADDGEILAKGGQVFAGYWNNGSATNEMIVDGWLHTGDVGSLDDEGYLTITGRKKELIVTSLGKNVAPAPLEDALRAHPLVSQSVVIGDRRPYITALIALDPDQVEFWARRAKKSQTEASALHDDTELRAEVQHAVDKANASVSQAESIRKWALVAADFGVETGELTPTLKVKRNVVLDRYADLVESLYADHGAGI